MVQAGKNFPVLAHIALFAGLVTSNCHGIIDGTPAGESEFPSVAAIMKPGASDAFPVIGSGILVGNQWVLTAAHSLQGESPSGIQLWFGVEDLSEPEGRIVRTALAFYVHPDFEIEGGITIADLALILLDRPVEGIAPLPVVAHPEDVSPGDDCLVAGWGTTTPGVSTPSLVLNKADAAILALGVANPFYAGNLIDVHLPARDPAQSGRPCFGDSGGPLLKKILSVDTLVGLVSFGDDDCSSGAIPSVYTNLVEFSAWVQEHLNLTAEPSSLTVTGKNKVIASGDFSPRKADATDFGFVRSNRKRVVKTFGVANAGDGLLTAPTLTVNGRRFSLKRSPSTVLPASGQSNFKIQFRPTGKSRRYRAWIRLHTNDPVIPVHSFRIQARSR